MPDPNEFPVTGSGLSREDAPQQAPQASQPQYGYQQPQQPQYGYQQPQQPQYGYQQPRQAQQPQYGYQQPQQSQYGYQHAQQPQYGYQQPQYAQQPYGYRQSASVPTVTHKKAIGSMIMMILALTFLFYPLGRSLIGNFRNAFDYGNASSWLGALGNLSLITGLTLMLVGAIIGSRGHALFGVGLLLCLGYQLVDRIYYVIMMMDYYEDGLGAAMLLLGIMLVTGTLLAAIGCLTRVKALKIVGGILMLVNFLPLWILDFASMLDWYGEGSFILLYLLHFLGSLFAIIAVLAFPIRRVKA